MSSNLAFAIYTFTLLALMYGSFAFMMGYYVARAINKGTGGNGGTPIKIKRPRVWYRLLSWRTNIPQVTR